MERQKEVILQNTILENVLKYLYNKMKELSGRVIENKDDDGTIYAYCIQNVFPSNSNRIDVKYTSVVTPKGDTEKAHGYWGELIAMSFEGLQLQTNTVLIKAECKHPFIMSIFDDYWADMFKAFSTAQSFPIDEGQTENVIADNQGGTITYKRNEQGQTIITGGAVNPGYYAELGQGVAIKPESPIRINHTTGSFQPGLYPSQVKDEIIKITSDTLAGLTEHTSIQPEQKNNARRKGKSGRPNHAADIWAWEQVNKLNRPMNEVRQEWIVREDVKARELQDSKRQFNRIIKPEWGNKSGQNI